MNRCYLHTVVITLSLLALQASAQSVSLFNIDRSTPTLVKAKVRVIDKDGKRITGLTSGDFIVTENGKNRKVTAYSCPPETPTNTISAALSIDISGSMNSSFNGSRSVDYAKTTCEHLIKAFTMPPTEVALQQCNDRADILRDFTNDRASLLTTLASVDADGANDFTEHLLNQYSGLLSVAARGKYKRYAILCSDAYFGKLSPATLQRCLDLCAQNDITFYAILFNDQTKNANGVRASLQTLADATGGWLREGVVTSTDAKNIALELSGELGGSAACDIEWESETMCDPLIATEITVPKYNLTTTITRWNSLIKGYLEVLPFSIRFGKVTPPLSGERTVKLVAKGGDVAIRGLSVTNPLIAIKANPAPLIIRENTEVEVTLVYTPVDTSFISGYLKVSTDYCEDSLELSVPVSAGVTPVQNLVLVKPLGGQTFVAGEDTVIEWKGVDPSDPVKLEYSTNAGASWSIVADSAFGLRHDWRVPLPAGTQNKMRATLVSDELPTSFDFALIKRYPVFDSLSVAPTYAEISPDNKQIMVSAEGIHLYDAATARWEYSFTNNPTATTPPMFVGNNLVIGCAGGSLFALNVTPGSQGKTWLQTSGVFTSLSVSPDRTKIVTTSNISGIEVWPVAGGGRIHQLWGHLGDAVNAAFDKTSKYIVTAGADGTARIWDLATGTETQKVTTVDPCSGVAFHPASWTLLTTTEGGRLDWWDIATGTSAYNLDLTMTSPNRLMFNNMASILMAGSSVNPVGRVLKENAGVFTVGLNIGDAFTNWNSRPPMSKDGRLILNKAFGSPTIVSVWDMTGSRIVGQMSHPGIVRSATFSEDERYIVTTTDREAFLWEVSSYSDTGKKFDSTSRFTVIAPQAVSVNVDMGPVLIGTKKDSVVTGYITNTGTYRVRIDSMTISGADAADFLIQSFPPEVIDPGATVEVEFGFAPSAAGARNAVVKIHTRIEELQQTITGIGVNHSIQTLGNVVDLGIHPIGATFDSTLVVAVTNVGASPIDILSTDLLGPDKDQFSIVSGGGNFTLQPNESRSMVLRFSPQYIGRASSNIGFAYNGVGSPAVLRLFGQGIGGTVYIPDDSAAAGDLVNIALLLKGVKKYIQQDGATKFNAEVSFDATVLTPIDAAARGTIQNGVQTISLASAWDRSSDTLAVIPMRVGLGANETTTVGIPAFRWLDDFDKEIPLAIDVQPGTFTLIGLCEEGGKRLFNPTGQASLRIQPNPAAGEKVTIEYETIETGLTQLSIYNALGNTVKEITSYEAQFNTIDLDLEHFSNGLYYCILRTPTMQLRKTFYIGK